MQRAAYRPDVEVLPLQDCECHKVIRLNLAVVQ
jgi:hypothetical protein